MILLLFCILLLIACLLEPMPWFDKALERALRWIERR